MQVLLPEEQEKHSGYRGNCGGNERDKSANNENVGLVHALYEGGVVPGRELFACFGQCAVGTHFAAIAVGRAVFAS